MGLPPMPSRPVWWEQARGPGQEGKSGGTVARLAGNQCLGRARTGPGPSRGSPSFWRPWATREEEELSRATH